MADKLAISGMLGKGGWAYDAPDVDYLADMFTEDGRFELRSPASAPSARSRAAPRSASSTRTRWPPRPTSAGTNVTNIFFEDETDTR